MINWIRKFFLKRAISQKKEISNLEKTLDESISQAIKDSNSTARIAEKALKQKILQQQTDRTIKKIQELDEDFDDSEEEEEEEQAQQPEDIIKEKILNSFLEKITGGNSKAPVANSAAKALENPNVEELIKTITPEQMKLLKEKGFIQ